MGHKRTSTSSFILKTRQLSSKLREFWTFAPRKTTNLQLGHCSGPVRQLSIQCCLSNSMPLSNHQAVVYPIKCMLLTNSSARFLGLCLLYKDRTGHVFFLVQPGRWNNYKESIGMFKKRVRLQFISTQYVSL